MAELKWIKMILAELKIKVPDPMVVWCDNTGAVVFSKYPILHIKSKHFAMNYHFVSERVAENTLVV